MEQSGIEAAHHLARHGLRSSFHEVPRNGRDVYDVLTTAAQKTGCDLIAFGAVRHSPIHELAFAGRRRRAPEQQRP